jgi:hypothetical protein
MKNNIAFWALLVIANIHSATGSPFISLGWSLAALAVLFAKERQS